jgi:hypothetical protein
MNAQVRSRRYKFAAVATLSVIFATPVFAQDAKQAPGTPR